jgi:LPLT family lysophospholipid transporter-like MFS transporter
MSARRNFPLLLASQFLGAFADQAMLAVILGQLTFQQEAGQISAHRLSGLNAVYSSLLFIPFIVLAPFVGYLNDRYPKTGWLAGGNLIKLAGVALAATSVWLGPVAQGAGYLLAGVGAAVFSPAKYGILPEIVGRDRLVVANGLLEFLTIAAILSGFIAGASLIDHWPVLVCYGALLMLYSLSLGLNLLMTRTRSQTGVDWRRSVDEFYANFGRLLEHPRLFRVLCGLGLFWFCAAAIKMNFQPWGLNVLELHTEPVTLLGHSFSLGVNTQIAFLGLWLSLGVMGGAMLVGRLHRVGDLRGVRPYGWALAGLFALLAAVEVLKALEVARGRGIIIGLLITTGIVAGLFLIPLNAALQSECDPERLGKTIAAMNFVDNLGMLAAGGTLLLAANVGIGASGVFLLLAASLAFAVTFLRMPRVRPARECNGRR